MQICENAQYIFVHVCVYAILTARERETLKEREREREPERH